MRVTRLEELAPGGGAGRRVAVGTFDGVHLGHQAVIAGSDTVLTFEPHPLTVLRPDAAPPLLTPFELKRDAVAALGVDDLVVIDFTPALARRSAQDFVDSVLVERLRAVSVSVGENFRFGRGAEGDARLLAADGRFETRTVALVDVDGAPVSSSRIRALLAAGEVAAAARLLGRPFAFAGEVVGGDRRGRTLGMPTANIVPERGHALPADGVYAARARGHLAAVNVGVRPTFASDRGVLVECHLIDFDGDLYGERLRIEFLERLRPEQRFDSTEALVEQMRRDVEAVRTLAP